MDLYYDDELANQDDIIKLTVKKKETSGAGGAFVVGGFGDAGEDEGGPSEEEDRPPLEKVIETRWPKVTVDWNGSEPIL